jgi:hypothetical protein
MEKIATHYLTQACTAATQTVERDFNQQLLSLTAAQLRHGVNIRFVGETINKCIANFETKALALFPHVLEYSPQKTEDCRKAIQNTVKSCYDRLFLKRCIDIALPELETKVVDEINREIDNEMSRVQTSDIGVFSFTHLSVRYEKAAEARFTDEAIKIHQALSSEPKFSTLVTELRGKISQYVNQIEAKRKQEFDAYQKAERDKREQELDAQYQENLKRMSEEKAKELRRLEEEKAALLQEQRNQEAQHKAMLEQQQASLKAQLEMQERHHQAMLAAQEREASAQREFFNQLRTAHEESMARVERERQEERAAAAQRDAALQAQIQQLSARPPPRRHHGCLVF